MCLLPSQEYVQKKPWTIVTRSIDTKRQEHVARSRSDAAVSGIDEQHPAADDERRAVDAGASAFDAVDGVELLVRIELPEDLSVGGRIGTDTAVERHGEDCSRNERRCTALRRVATRRAFA